MAPGKIAGRFSSSLFLKADFRVDSITRGRSTVAWLVSCASLFLLALVQSGCDRRPSVVVYVSADESVARPILIEFERTSGVRVDPVFDTEATKTTGLAQRLRSERDRPRADVFWSSEIAQTIRLAEEGVLMEAHSADLDAWPSQHRDPSSRWFSFAARARVIVYSTERVTKEEVPGTWMHLTRDRWRGRIAMADPRFGTTRTHMGVLASMWERRMMPGFFEAWLQGLHENQIALLTSGNGGVVEAIAHGQFDIGMTDTDDVWAGQAQGWKIDLVYPRHVAQADEPTGGTLLIPNTCALVAQPLTDAKRHAAALQLLEYLLSPAVERALLNSPSRNIPLGPGLATEASGVTPPDPLQLDWGLAAGASDDAAARAASLLREPAVIAPGRDGADSESSASDLEAVDPVATKAPSQLVGRGA